MSNNDTITTSAPSISDNTPSDIVKWDETAPKGGRAVLNRMVS